MAKIRQQRRGAPGASFAEVAITVVVAFVIGMTLYGPLAAYEFDFFVFEEFSVSKTAGSWSGTLKYVSAAIFSILSGCAVVVLTRGWDIPFPARLPLALCIGVMGMAALITAIGILVSTLALIALLLALFFGPGDR